MRYCPICSKELQDDMQFCPSCGTSVQITDEDPMPNRATYVGEPIPKKNAEQKLQIYRINHRREQ